MAVSIICIKAGYRQLICLLCSYTFLVNVCSQTHLFSKWGITLWKRTLCGFTQSKSWDYWFATLRKKKNFLYWCFFMILSINHFYKDFNGFCGGYFEFDTAFPFQKSKSLMGREWPQYFCFHNWLLKQFPSHSPNIFTWRSSILLWDKNQTRTPQNSSKFVLIWLYL